MLFFSPCSLFLAILCNVHKAHKMMFQENVKTNLKYSVYNNNYLVKGIQESTFLNWVKHQVCS
jgi:hypothetical protein